MAGNNRATVRREVEKTALKTEICGSSTVHSQTKVLKSLTRPNIEQLLVELDGHIRTGILLPVEKPKFQKTPTAQT